MSKHLHNKIIAGITALVMSALAYAFSLWNQKTPEPAGEWYIVTRVVDGDTIVMKRDGTTDRVRLLCIDTPETVHPQKPVECFGKEASAYTTNALTDKRVQLETDASQGMRDSHDRMLAYVYLEDGSLFNETIVRDGYAYEYTYDDPYKYQNVFKQAQNVAQNNKSGLWASGVCE